MTTCAATTIDAPTCYICYEEASATQPFLAAPVCACKGSLALHRTCYEQSRLIAPSASTCSVCKQPYNDPEMYEEFDYTNSDYMRYVGRRHKLTKQFDGPYTVYYSNGALWFQTTYRNGNRHGPYAEYYEDGQLEREYTYKNSEIHGSYKQYYEDGGLCVEAEYAYDERHGPYKEYYQNGTLAYHYTYNEGYKCGNAISYYETGVKRRATTYDMIGGIALKDMCYYESGSLESMCTYTEEGELVYQIEYYDVINAKAREQQFAGGKCVYFARWRENGELIA